MTLDEFFGDHSDSRQLYDTLFSLVNALGPVEAAVTKSQITLRRKKPFAWLRLAWERAG